MRRALEQLEEGNEDVARVELVAYLNASPSSKTARSLLRQIDTPTEEYFPSASREVALEAGQSLSTIAKTYLGSAVEFYALAKYNDIARPKRMIPGQIVAVPLTEKAIAAFDALDNGAVMGEELTEEAASDIDATAVAPGTTAPEAADTPLLSNSNDEASGDMQAVRDQGELADDDGSEPTAPSPDVSDVADDSGSDESDEELSESGEEALIDEIATPTVPTIDIEATHRRAINAYRSQDLDTAIELWDQILEVDPHYESARLYRSQAQALKERLRRLN
ncbi:MAG: hypothetical protein Cons2KO_25780 [Congregibacter sp.]